ncbi:MAG TPA: hypothetical protein VHL53_06735 [Acidimicrobiia bacterium]|nr:hypothetical protein [Acidimicrobiia bacterium]
MATNPDPKPEGDVHQPARPTVPGLDPQLVGEPVDTEDGPRRPVQQNVGYGVEEGGGEFPDPNTPPSPGAPGAQ